MDKELATKLIADIVRAQKAIDAAYESVCLCPDESKKDWMRRQLAEATGSLVEITIDVCRTHPDLNPYPRKSSG